LSTEAEYFAITEVSKEIKPIKQAVEWIGYEVKYPVILKIDNVGAIYLAKQFCN
jgi:hypothetical protein